MSNNRNLLELLSHIMSEELCEDDPILQNGAIYDSLTSLINKDLMSKLEPVCLAEKYNIIDEIKSILEDYKLFLYFPELMGKNIAAFYGINDISAIITQYFGAEKAGENIKGNTWIPSGIPCIFTMRAQNDFRFLNHSDNLISLNDEDYLKIKKLINKKFDIKNLMSVLSVNFHADISELAVLYIPNDNADKYSCALARFADMVIVGPKAVDKFIKEGHFIFKNARHIIVIGSLSNSQKADIESLCHDNDCSAKYFDSFKNATETVKEYGNGTVENYSIAMQIEEKINEIIVVLARKIEAENSSFSLINKDLIINNDVNAQDFIKGIKAEYSCSADIDIKQFNDLIDTRNSIRKKLEEFVSNEAVNNASNGKSNAKPHCISLNLEKELFMQYLHFNFIDKSFSEELSLHQKALSGFGKQYEYAAELLTAFYNGDNLSNDLVSDFLSMESSDQFILKAQIIIGNAVSPESAALPNAARHLKKADTAEEHYYLGCYFEQSEQQMALEEYKTALELGLTKAGERLLKLDRHYIINSDELKKLADNYIPSACYQYGKNIISTNEDMGETYIKIAASLKNSSALRYLSDHYYQKFKKEYQPDNSDKNNPNLSTAIKYYETVLECTDTELDDKEILENLGELYYYNKQYEKATQFCEKADTGKAYYIAGRMLENGQGYARDYNIAKKLYKHAIDLGYDSAQEDYERVCNKLSQEQLKELEASSASYSSYSSYDYESSDSAGCVKEGTKILTVTGNYIPIELIHQGMEILNCNGSVSLTSDELVINNKVDRIYSVNDDEPFMSLEHAILTQRGWCSLAPELSMNINSNFKVEKLKVGDVIQKAKSVDGNIVYTKEVVERINIANNTLNTRCYDLHFFDGFNSYFANGYPCLLNYPTFTLSSLKKNLSLMTAEQRTKFNEMTVEYREVLDIIFGKTNIDCIFKMEKSIENF